MRTTLLPGLVTAARRNLSRGAAEVALSEVGLGVPRFRHGQLRGAATPVGGWASQRRRGRRSGGAAPRAAAARRGASSPASGTGAGWWGAGRPADWSDAIGIVRDLAAELGVAIEVAAGSEPALAPGPVRRDLGRWPGHRSRRRAAPAGHRGARPARAHRRVRDRPRRAADGRARRPRPPRCSRRMPVAKEDLAVVGRLPTCRPRTCAGRSSGRRRAAGERPALRHLLRRPGGCGPHLAGVRPADARPGPDPVGCRGRRGPPGRVGTAAERCAARCCGPELSGAAPR